MQELHSTRRPPFWHPLRRPSTLVILGAGLLAADPLRWLLAPWTDATLPSALRVAAALLAFGVALWRLMQRPRRREVRTVTLPVPASSPPLCDRTLGRRR